MEKLIKEYSFKVAESGCSPGSGRYGLQVHIPQDIGPVFPFLNALLDNARYDHQNSILIWREKDQAFALRAHEINIANTGGIQDPEQARMLVREIVERLNKVWEDREGIKPCVEEKSRPTTIEIFKLLPKTNCKQCGYPTCLVFAAELCEGKVELSSCTALLEPVYADKKQNLMGLMGCSLP